MITSESIVGDVESTAYLNFRHDLHCSLLNLKVLHPTWNMVDSQ